MACKRVFNFRLLTIIAILPVLSFFDLAIVGIGGTEVGFNTATKYSTYLQCPILFQPGDVGRLSHSISIFHSRTPDLSTIPMSDRQANYGLRVSDEILRSLAHLNTRNSTCSGTMISQRAVLTSASCLPSSSDPESLSVRLGIAGRRGEFAKVDNWTVFKDGEKSESHDRDELSVAVVILNDSYPFVTTMAVNSNSSYPFSASVARFAAFRSDDQGIQADFPIRSINGCNTYDYFSSYSMICAGYSSEMALSDPCHPRYVSRNVSTISAKTLAVSCAVTQFHRLTRRQNFHLRLYPNFYNYRFILIRKFLQWLWNHRGPTVSIRHRRRPGSGWHNASIHFGHLAVSTDAIFKDFNFRNCPCQYWLCEYCQDSCSSSGARWITGTWTVAPRDSRKPSERTLDLVHDRIYHSYGFCHHNRLRVLPSREKNKEKCEWRTGWAHCVHPTKFGSLLQTKCHYEASGNLQFGALQ